MSFYLTDHPSALSHGKLVRLWEKFLSTYPTKVPPKKGFRIVTFNLNNFRDARDKKQSEKQLESILSWDADVVCLQEVGGLSKFPKNYESLLKVYPYYQLVNVLPGRWGFGNLILSRYRFREGLDFILPGKTREYRGVCKITLEYTDGREIDLWNTHLDVYDESGETRRQQLHKILQCLDPERRNIICGDFNALQKEMYDASQWEWLRHNQASRGISLTSFELDPVREAGFQTLDQLLSQAPAQVSCWTGRRVDHFFTLNLKPQHLQASFLMPYAYSDHLPVALDLNR